MRLELDTEEGRELLSLVVNRLAEEAELSNEDRAAVRRWRSDQMKAGSDDMRELTEKINADLERALRSKEKSAVQKPDWR
jgi:ribosome recycling factor